MDYHAFIKRLCPRGNAAIIAGCAAAFPKYLPGFGISAKTLRLAHFAAQAAHECDQFKTLSEYASGSAYEGRKDLGNTQAGDGRRFKGRGIFQLTGRANYRSFGKLLGIDLEKNPERAADADVSVKTACLYWADRKLNTLADRDDVRGITKRINGGYNGLAHREALLKKAKLLLADKTDDQVKDELSTAESRAKAARNAQGTGAATGTAVGTDTATPEPSVIPPLPDLSWDWASAFYVVLAVVAAGAVIWLAWRAYLNHQRAKALAKVNEI